MPTEIGAEQKLGKAEEAFWKRLPLGPPILREWAAGTVEGSRRVPAGQTAEHGPAILLPIPDFRHPCIFVAFSRLSW